MDDEEDVRKMMEVLKCKQENIQEFEFVEFINNNCDDSDAEETPYDTAENEVDHLLSDLTNTDITTLNTYDPRYSLKPEEHAVIDSCTDLNLKNILILNRSKNIQLIQLYKKMKDLLEECQRNIQDKNKVIKAYSESNKGQTNSTGAWRLGAPYFKDKQLYASPQNDDTLLKKGNKELSIYDLSANPKWSSLECEKLLRAVKFYYSANYQKALQQKIQKLSVNNENVNKEEISELETKLAQLSNNEENGDVPPLNSNEYIDWLRVSEVFLKDKHSALECKSIWHLYVHPLINKLLWSPAENEKLKTLAKKYKYQNWDLIATKLGTNRTGFTACLNYYGNLHDRFKRGEFTYEEDARLMQLVYQYRVGSYIPWYKIVQHFSNRTRTQLHYRYTYYISQGHKKRGKFSEAEDVLLMILVDRFGKNFKKCTEYLPTRSMVQCKSRFNTNLQASIKKGSFTLEEDKIIMKYVEEHGTKSWTNLTKILNRSRGQIRQRYLTIMQFLEGNSEMTLEKVPRRKHRISEDDCVFDLLRLIADQYRESPTIPTVDELQMIIKNKKKSVGLPAKNEKYTCVQTLKEHKESDPLLATSNIDDLLTDFFCSSFKINSQKTILASNLTKAVKDITSVATTLNVRLDIPKGFEQNPKLDNLDVAILNRLLDDNPGGSRTLHFNSKSGQVDTLVPPNLNNVVGLRSLLIKFSHYRSEENSEMVKFMQGQKRQTYISDIRSNIISDLISMPAEVRMQVENERKLFHRRFLSLYKWPSIMTLESPSTELFSTCNFVSPGAPPTVKRTYSRVSASSVSANDPKRAKVDPPKVPDDPKPPKAVPIKLTPVKNKSVIEDLLKNKDRKLFCFDKIQCDGVTKTVIREVPLANIKGKSSVVKPVTEKKRVVTNMLEVPGSSKQAENEANSAAQFNTDLGECVVNEVDDLESVATVTSVGDEESFIDDEEDLKKLDTMLNEDYGCEELDEDEDLKDLQKLEMFLKNEKAGNEDSSDGSLFC